MGTALRLTLHGISMRLMPRLREADESTHDRVNSYEAGEPVLGCFKLIFLGRVSDGCGF